jgi:hypothetical protein
MPSTGLRLLSFVMSMVTFEGEVGFRPWCCDPWEKHRCGRSVLLSCCGCGGGERGLCAVPSRGRAAEASFST